MGRAYTSRYRPDWILGLAPDEVRNPMPRDEKRLTQHRSQIIFGALLVIILYAEFGLNEDYEPIVHRGPPVVLAAERVQADPFERLIRHEPLDALAEARERLIRESPSYRCTFIKQERIRSNIRAEQEVEVKFRSQPFSVVMNWVRNPSLAQRVIYVRGKWVDPDATDPKMRNLAVCQPIKPLALIKKSVRQPIHGIFAERSSRRSIDEFGFKRALDLLIKFSRFAESQGELSLEFKGETHFDGRPVWLVRRRLPYKDEGGLYPDLTADILIDKEYHVPVAVYCYSDAERKPQNLLGKYEYRNIRFDVEFTDRDFDPATYGM